MRLVRDDLEPLLVGRRRDARKRLVHQRRVHDHDRQLGHTQLLLHHGGDDRRLLLERVGDGEIGPQSGQVLIGARSQVGHAR